MTGNTRVKFNVLAWTPARSALMSPALPVALQFLSLVGVLLLAFNGLGIGADMKAEELMTLRKTNLTTLAVWGLWWPGMIAAALVFGRAWCLACPLELVNRAGDAVARKIGWPRARLGRFLRAGWLIVLLYLSLQLLVAGLSIHRVPHYTSVFLLALVGGALITGLLFSEPRSFCRAFCPAGALLSVYGRYTPLHLETCDPSVCEVCSTKDCVRPENRGRFDKRSCPSLLVPFRRRASDGCVLCLQCAKVCPSGNVGFGVVDREAPARRKALLRPFEAAFVMVALGFVAHEVIGEVKWLDAWFHAVPNALSRFLPSVPFGWIEAFWFLTLFPLLVWVGLTGVGYCMGHRGTIKSFLLAAATGAAPVVAIAHLAKATAKIAAWGGFLPMAARDPNGLEAFRLLLTHTLAAPAALLGLSPIGWAMLGLTLFVAWRAWRWARHVPAESVRAARTGLAGASMLFGLILTIWAWPVS